MTKHGKPGLGPSRRSVLKGSLMTASLAGVGVFYGPWEHNRAFAQGKKPIKLGLTNDASGQFGNSGQDDHRAIRMVIDEWNARGGVLGRKIEWVTADTEFEPSYRHPHRRTLHYARGLPNPYRGAAFGGCQRHHAGRQQIRHHLSQHQFLGPERGGRELQPYQVRLGW